MTTDPDSQTTSPWPAPRPGALPPDLEPHETGLAAWFAVLERPEAPPALREDVLAAAFDAPEALPLPTVPGRNWMVPFAAAACLLLTVGMLTLAHAARRAEVTARAAERTRAMERLEVVEDPSVPLFHGWDLSVAGLADGG